MTRVVEAAVDAAPVPSFEELGVAADLVEVLARGGITVPSEIQVMTIPDALAGRDVSGKAQTGSGKTLAFGLPLIERTETAVRRRPRSLVLVPTRELANQVAESLAPLAVARRLWLSTVYGGVSMFRQIQALHAGVDIVIATPGRMNDLLERGELSLADVSTVVIDEADQMSDMGFLPQVERILAHVNDAQVMLFSATLDGAIGSLVRKYQHEPVRHEVMQETISVETLEHRFIGATAEEKAEVAAQICAGARRALVFVRTTHGADRVATQLERFGLRTAALHGRLAQGRRERTLAAFTKGETTVLVATNVAARGLHVDGLDIVIHYDLPEDAKTYVHRSGRTARAGEEGLAVTLCLPNETRDVALLQRDAGLNLRVVEMKPGDPRLLDLNAWEPPLGAPSVDSPRNPRAVAPGAPRRSGPARRPARAAQARGAASGRW
ncbi:MAG: DEAD/DEAH box helicase [Dehalococcoidia bacterium]|nr:DEAD/DEAH box helicase [Dehalococcoidia bacterium]